MTSVTSAPVPARVVLNQADIDRALTRIAHEILEANKGSRDLVLLGIPRRGYPLAVRLAEKIAAADNTVDAAAIVGQLDVTMFRDDLSHQGTRPPYPTRLPRTGIDNKVVVLIDDVLYSGRTIRAALDALVDLGRPRIVRLAVLIDRGHRELPIRADHVGKNLPTSSAEKVRVRLEETDSSDGGSPVNEVVIEGGRMKHLLSTEDLSLSNAIRILDTAEEMSAVGEREVKKLPALRGRTVVNLFFEDSTRTRISFEAAAKRLSADVINFAAKGSSVSKGESLKDTAQTLSAMGADAVVIRHWASGAPHRLAATDWIDAAVINAGDGTHEHPTQALLDAFTMRRHWARLSGTASEGTDLKGMRVAIAGDVLHSRVARSNVWLLRTLGAEVTLVAPPTLLPVGVDKWPCSVSYDLDQTLANGVDAMMMLRVQGERMNASFFPSTREYSRRWGFDDNRLRALDDLGMTDTIIMHPGPMNRGLEISAAAADSPRSTVLAQVRNGVSVRMAALYLLLSGDTREPAAHRAPAYAAAAPSPKESN